MTSCPYQAHSDESREAAEAAEEFAATTRGRVFWRILRAGEAGKTDEEIHRETGIDLNTVRPRRRELEKLGMIRKSGEKRPTGNGRRKSMAAVWVAVIPGEQLELGRVR